MVKATWVIIQGLVVNESKMIHKKSPKTFVSVFFEAFKWYIFFYFLKFILSGGKLLYNIVVVLPSIDMNQPWVYMCPHLDPPSHLPPHPIRQGHPTAPALSTLSHTLNLDWRSVSHMIIYMFQCYSLKSSHPHLLPQSPKVFSLYLCLFCCLAYRVVNTIYLNSIYMH